MSLRMRFRAFFFKFHEVGHFCLCLWREDSVWLQFLECVGSCMFPVSSHNTSSLFLSSALNCHWCDSKQVKCERTGIGGLTSIETCKRGYEFCAVQTETNSSGIVVQFTRGCVANCPQMVSKWKSNTFFKSSYCRYCCNTQTCNKHNRRSV